MGVHNEGLHYANSRAVDLYLITLTGRSFIWISHPRECACSAYAEVVFTAFLQGRRNVFFPSFFLLLLLSPFSSMFSAFSIDILSRVRINCYLIITRDYYFSFLFLENKKKSSFLPWRKINTREGWDLEGICAHTVPPPRGGVVVQSRFVTTRLHGRYCAWRCGFLSGARIFRYTWKYVEGRVRSRRVGRGVELSVETPILSPVQSLSWLCRFEEMLRLPSLLLFSHSRIVISSFRSFSGEEREKKKEGKKKEEKYALSPCTFTLTPLDPHALHLCNFVPPFYPVCVLIDRSSRF